MPLTELEKNLRLRARNLVAEHRLPGTMNVRTFGGYGSRSQCSLCGLPIRSEEVEYEVEEEGPAGKRTYILHFMCHAAWQFECARYDHLRKDDP